MLASQLVIMFSILLSVAVAVLAVGSYDICFGLYIKAHCRGKAKEKVLALSFDDGPDANTTPAVLDILNKYNIKAGFFVIGKMAEKNPELIKRITAEGHIVGNHSYTHNNKYPFKSTKNLLKDLQKNEDLIHSICDKRVKLFRPPFGVTNPNIARAARLLDYSVLGWSIRSLDTMGKSNEKIIERVLNRIQAGRVILFHDNHAGIIPILEAVINKALAEGYEFVSPDVLLNIKAYK